MTPIPRLKPYAGPALFSYGFRPFFLSGSLFAGLAVLVWLPMYFGDFELPTAFAPRDWHAHEMIYGFVPAVVTGFLLTAIPNWTGRMPLQGRPLAVLFGVWLAGRVAVAVSAHLPWGLVAAIDLAFPALVGLAAAREVVAGKNWRNLRVLVIFALFIVGDFIFHLEAHFAGAADVGLRFGVGATVLMISLIGGRVVPSFTRNWLARENPGRMPAPFGRLDAATIVLTAAALAFWTFAPGSRWSALLLAFAGLANAIRLARWAGDRTFADRLVFVLHAAYAFLPIGLGLLALAAAGRLPQSAGLHALAVGGFGLMTMAVMSRASLGHTGRPLAAWPTVQIVYALLAIAAAARVCAALIGGMTTPLLVLAAAAWASAFIGFAFAYWRVFTGPSLSPKR